MNYQRHYFLLISRAQQRTPLATYTERHHIVPRCIGGDDSAFNLVDLTPEEHYVAHQLLVKIFPTERKLIFAATAMAMNSNGRRPNNKLYGWLKRKMVSALTGVPKSEEIKKRMKLSAGRRVGYKHSDEVRQKIAIANQVPKSEEHKANISFAMRGKAQSPEHIAKRAAAIRATCEKRLKSKRIHADIDQFGK